MVDWSLFDPKFVIRRDAFRKSFGDRNNRFFKRAFSGARSTLFRRSTS